MGVVGLEWVAVIGRGTKSCDSKQRATKTVIQDRTQANPGLKEKVHIREGSLHAANYIYCLCDDCFFVCLSENVACVRVRKSEDHFLFFLVVHQNGWWKLFSVKMNAL